MAALGLAPHSGWAAAVAVAEVDAALRVLVRERIELADPSEPGSRQPYHTVEGLPVADAARQLATYERRAAAMAKEAVARIAGRLAEAGHRLSGVGILESTGRKGKDLAATLASHALIHAADGNHFRTALAAGAERCGLSVLRVPARVLEAEAAARLGESPSALREGIRKLGRDIGPPWAADQKAAALAAWLVLARGRATRPGEK